MISHWDEFTLAPSNGEPMSKRVSLTIRGEICFNRRVLYLMGSPTHVLLYFDRVNSLIGVRAGKPEQENAFPLKSWGSSGSRFIRAKKFCNFHEIEIRETVVFKVPRIKNDGFLVLDLKATYTSPYYIARRAEPRMFPPAY